MYRITLDAPAHLTDTLTLNSAGRFAVNVVDNLVVVHHQMSKVRSRLGHGVEIILRNSFLIFLSIIIHFFIIIVLRNIHVFAIFYF